MPKREWTEHEKLLQAMTPDAEVREAQERRDRTLAPIENRARHPPKGLKARVRLLEERLEHALDALEAMAHLIAILDDDQSQVLHALARIDEQQIASEHELRKVNAWAVHAYSRKRKEQRHEKDDEARQEHNQEVREESRQAERQEAKRK